MIPVTDKSESLEREQYLVRLERQNRALNGNCKRPKKRCYHEFDEWQDGGIVLFQPCLKCGGRRVMGEEIVRYKES